MTVVARTRNMVDVVPILKAKISGEPSDYFLDGLLRILQVLAPLISPRDLKDLESKSRQPIAKVVNALTRWSDEQTLLAIPAIVREYREYERSRK